jgi:hypothetical protein
MMYGDHLPGTANTVRTVIEVGTKREKLSRDMEATQAQDWSKQLIACGFVIEQSNAFRTVFFDHISHRRAWCMRSTLYRPDMPVVV